jgi:hypothetical protein
MIKNSNQIERLPREIIIYIYDFLNQNEIHEVSRINKYLHLIYWNDIKKIIRIRNQYVIYEMLEIFANKLPQKIELQISYPLIDRDIISRLGSYTNFDSIHFTGFNEIIDFYETSNIQELHFFLEFNKEILHWPSLLEIVTFIGIFNQPIHNFYSRLKHIMIISTTFNQSIDELPDSVNSIIIHSNAFNQKINKLPQLIEELYIKSDIFNQTFDDNIFLRCMNFRKITLKDAYNYPIDHFANVKIIELGYNFQQKVDILKNEWCEVITSKNYQYEYINIQKIRDNIH